MRARCMAGPACVLPNSGAATDAAMGGTMKSVLALFALSALLSAAPGRAEKQISTLEDVVPGRELLVLDEDNGGSVKLAPNDTLVVRLRANPSTGTTWYMVLSPGSLVELTGHSYTPDPHPPGSVGSGGYEEFRFRPTRAAASRSYMMREWLRMLNLRSWEPGVKDGTLWEIEINE